MTMLPAALVFAIGTGLPAKGAQGHFTVVVDAGPVDRLCEPVSIDLPTRGRPMRVSLRERETHRRVPVQVSRGLDDRTARVIWIVRDLPAGQKRVYDLTSVQGEPLPTGDVGVRVSPAGEGQLRVAVGGKPFTICRFGPDLPRPFCFPVLGVRGENLTRAYPMAKGIPGETTDHPHHRSFWFAFGSVNGVDCWSEGPQAGRTLHRALETVESGSVFGRLRSVNDWLAHDGKKLMEDVRELRIYDVGPDLRMFDFEITLRATDGPVTLGDTKEGMFAFRVASTMDVKPDGRGGKIVNSAGEVNEAQAWGKRADWCDYSGPVEGGISGIAILDHPDNLRRPTYWMVRDYGLFAANPFGVRAYTGDPKSDGAYTIPPGESLTFRYRVVIHEGEASFAHVPSLWASYARPPSVTLIAR